MVNSENAYLFRLPPEKEIKSKIKISAKKDAAKKEPDEGEFILCRQCLHIITTPDERIEVDGSHEHTFANPHGIVYQIGCFRFAAGCGYVGPATEEFSWFKGFSWRVAVCSFCLTHLGWLFSSAGMANFNGLIIDCIVKSK